MDSESSREGVILAEDPAIEIQTDMAMFVVRGDLSVIDADVYLLPTDAYGTVTDSWSWLVGERRAQVRANADRLALGEPYLMPTSAGGVALAVNVGGDQAGNSTTDLRERFRVALLAVNGVVRDATERGRRFGSPHRARPLLAMPVMGVGAGGLREHTGDVLRMIIEELHGARRTGMGFDVVVVCRSASDYAAISDIRRRIGPPPSALVEELAGHAERGELSIMFGAGASMPLGLPSWGMLLERLARDIGFPAENVEALSRLDPVDAATILRQHVDDDRGFEQAIARHVRTVRCSLTHALMATINPRVAITTNYDRGFEVAAKAITGAEPPVLPWDTVEGEGGYVLKLHGDVQRGQIVLARDDFASVHVRSRPLIGVVQERLLAGHVLTVGSTVSDPTLIQAAEEVGALLGRMAGRDRQPSGTVVLTRDDPARSILLDRHFTIGRAQPAPTRVESSRPALDSVLEAARRVDILLDLVAMQAAPRYSFALTPRYRAMLDDEDLVVVDALEALQAALAGVPRTGSDSRLIHQVDAFLATLGAVPGHRGEETVTVGEGSLTADLARAADRWSRHPAIADMGGPRSPLRRIEVMEVLDDACVVRFHLLNAPAIIRTVRGLGDPGWNQFLLADEGAVLLEEATDSDFHSCSVLDIPVPPGAVFALMQLMESAIVEWEADDPHASEPIYWGEEDGYEDALEALVAYEAPQGFVVDCLHYVTEPREPTYRAVWVRGGWERVPDPISGVPALRSVALASAHARAFLDLVTRYEHVPFALAVLASLAPDDGVFCGDLSAGVQDWIGGLVESSGSGAGGDVAGERRRDPLVDFIDGSAELLAEHLFAMASAAWQGQQA